MTDHPNLTAALAAFQANLPRLGKGRAVDAGAFSYSYADLATVSATVLPLLAAEGLAWACTPAFMDGRYVLVGSLRHVSGDELNGEWPLPTNGPPKTLGGLVTYGRRYLLCALTGVAADDDDDAAAATRDHHERPQAQRRPAPERDPWAAADPKIAAQADGFAELAEQAKVKEDLRAIWTDARDAGILGIALGPDRDGVILADYLTEIGNRLPAEETP